MTVEDRAIEAAVVRILMSNPSPTLVNSWTLPRSVPVRGYSLSD
jgi:hypothetical protein